MKKNNRPLVSIIIPAHNAELYFAAAIQSIQNQSYKNWEMIIVNDGSTDSTGLIAKQYASNDKRIKVISYGKNKSESAAANIGFRQTKGVYIARMDADDIAHPDRLLKQVTFLENHPEYILVGTQANIIDETDQVVGEKTFPISHKAIYKKYGTIHPVLHPSIMIRRSMLPDKTKLWANEAEPNDDYFTLLRLLQYGKFYNLPQKLMNYRMHADNKSLQHAKKKFVNTLYIRYKAVTELQYPLTFDMISKSVLQTVIMLLLPESLVVGTFLWLKGMKPFSKAFPLVGSMQLKLGMWKTKTIKSMA